MPVTSSAQLGVLAVATCLCATGGEPAASFRHGPFALKPALHLYVLPERGPVTLNLTFTRLNPAKPCRLLFRTFDPDEKLTHWEYITPEKCLTPEGSVAQASATIGNEQRAGDVAAAVHRTVRLEAGSGVHEIRLDPRTSRASFGTKQD